MRFTKIITFVMLLGFLSGCTKEEVSLNTSSEEGFFPGVVSAPNFNRDHAAINIIASNMDFSRNRPAIMAQGNFFNKSSEPVGYELLEINSLSLEPNVANSSGGVDPLGRFTYQFFDEAGEMLEKYNKINEVFGGEVELKLESQSFGSVTKSLKAPSLTGVDFSGNEGYNNLDSPVVFSRDGITIKWDAPGAGNNSRDPIDQQVGIAFIYHAGKTERQVTDVTGEVFPSENMVYTVITPDDGEHTIDFQYISNFPSGGVHTITIGNGTTYNFEVDGNDNTIQVSIGTMINSDIFLLNDCVHRDRQCL